MELSQATRSQIEEVLDSNRVVLFMKGTREQPQCGFSAKATQILDMLVPEYTAVDVLADDDIRVGIKAFANWPTIPQLYLDGDLVGGCDIVSDMYQQGELQELLGLQIPPRATPTIKITARATSMLREALATQPEKCLRLTVNARWMTDLSFGSMDESAIKSEAGDVELFMDPITAQRADGLKIDVEDTLHGLRFSCENPNAPPPVQQIAPKFLRDMLKSGDIVRFIDVRPAAERAIAKIAGTQALELANEQMSEIDRLEKDTVLVFHCHLGGRSQQVAEHYRLRGFMNVYNLEGGIDAWSVEVDPSVPRY